MIYSRRLKTEERRNKKKALLLSLLTIFTILLIIFFGIPVVVKFTAFIYELKGSSEPIEITDNTPPPPPRFESSDIATNQDSLEIKGRTEAGASIVLTINRKKAEVLADSEGQFSYTLSLEDGENVISATARDNSGNESQKTEITIVYDDKPPTIEIINPKEGSEFYGSRQRQIIIDGKTEDGAKLQINNRLVIVDSDGTFSFTTTLTDGENIFNIKADDMAGNSKEEKLTVKYLP
ncbi:MAG: bacillopeptidase F [Candidatus Woesebacteria bacterium GW2011_GWB1_38_8]|uniref:Bacillopeptidase F n=2 Tax=Candidatus Woeseibacteriota TaxID=1752722 RepID=A0A0G0L1E1_9BACT|nr:MAG: bacillopeptidase F [Candidatus Woesebacteria bacterium GW2011_GWB1_38_8]OGM21940.1 MAG: hypothetical protein A2863_00935 [Candidatus Woesebacteria bacterium RIFCSPHIGHO2_01_FULL_38_9b]